MLSRSWFRGQVTELEEEEVLEDYFATERVLVPYDIRYMCECRWEPPRLWTKRRRQPMCVMAAMSTDMYVLSLYTYVT